jgi:hypothetical protein
VITDEQFKLATQRAKKKISTCHVTTSVHYDNTSERITISFSSGLELSFAPTTVQGLENAQPADLAEIEISPSGLGLYFPKVDTDLYIPSLLHGLLGTEKWMAENGRKGGRARTEAKIAASRENGKQGGRPRMPKSV